MTPGNATHYEFSMLSRSHPNSLVIALSLILGSPLPARAFDGPPDSAAITGDDPQPCEKVSGAISDQDWANMKLLMLSEKSPLDIPEIAVQENPTPPRRLRFRFTFARSNPAAAKSVLEALYKVHADRRIKVFIDATGLLPGGEKTFSFQGPRPHLSAHHGSSLVLSNVIKNWRTPYLADGTNERRETAIALVEFFVKNGVDPTFAPAGAKSPLRTALEVQDFETVRYLLSLPQFQQLPADHVDRETVTSYALLHLENIDDATLTALGKFSKPNPDFTKFFSSTRPDAQKLRFVIQHGEISQAFLDDAIYWVSSFTSNREYQRLATQKSNGRSIAERMAELKMEVLQILFNAGGEINPTTFTGDVTAGPLHNVLLAFAGDSPDYNYDIFTMILAGKLLSAGARIDLPNQKGEIPLALAFQNYQRAPETARMILERSTGLPLPSTLNVVDMAIAKHAAYSHLERLKTLGYLPSPLALMALTRKSHPDFLLAEAVEEFFDLFPDAKIDDSVMLEASKTSELLDKQKRSKANDQKLIAQQAKFIAALARHGGNLLAKDDSGFSVFINLNFFNDNPAVTRAPLNRILLNAEAPVNDETVYGDSLLLCAMNAKDWESVRLFLAVPGINVNAMDKRRIPGSVQDRARQVQAEVRHPLAPLVEGRASVLDFAEDQQAPSDILERLRAMGAKSSDELLAGGQP